MFFFYFYDLFKKLQMNIQDIHNLFLQCSSLSIDTRKIEKNSMFFAIKGENFDANTFAREALDLGALFVVIDNKSYFIDDRTILVEDSLQTLQELAKFHRNYLGLPIVALTGSNGKTTTKELINVVLAKKFKTKATIGNLNNHIGVPLTLLSFSKESKLVLIRARVHPFPFRTRKLSSLLPKILAWRRAGKIGNANINGQSRLTVFSCQVRGRKNLVLRQ